jgi:beta-1,4-mannosyl-glycoprotein beta-1,4-N-acetylglucosaminyltransferase
MKVIDAFSFFNEKNLLKLRLEYLSPVVDYFIVSESNYTHSGKPKPYYLEQFLDELPEEIRSKIIPLKYEPDITNFSVDGKVKEWDYGNDHWRLEREQRNLITKKLTEFAESDLFILGDVDEIPRREIIEQMKKAELEPDFCMSGSCDLFYYNFETSCGKLWTGSIFTTVGFARGKDCDYLRSNRGSFPPLPNAGWHFSYFGDAEQIRTKLESFAHQEYNQEKFKSEEAIAKAIDSKKNILDDQTFQFYPLSGFPDNLRSLIAKIFYPDRPQLKNTIDIVIPTMWYCDSFVPALERYCRCASVDNIFIVDNNHKNRPESDIFHHPKIKLINYRQNIYVNPAWNEGYHRSRADVLCLLNDDVVVEPELFDFISDYDLTDIDIIGSYLKGTVDNFHIDNKYIEETKLLRLNINKSQPIGGQSYAFGVCMFIKRSSYKVIPSLYKIWFGDDYLIQRCENIYALKTPLIAGGISKTLTKKAPETNKLQDRIDLDTANAYKFNHFMNGKDWDILQPRPKQSNIFGL